MASHLSMLCTAVSSLVPSNGRDMTNNGAPRSAVTVGTITSSSSGNGAVSGNVLEELNRTRDRNAESIANLEDKIEQTEQSHRDLAGQYVSVVGIMTFRIKTV